MSVDQLKAAWAVSHQLPPEVVCVDPSRWGNVQVVYLFGITDEWELLGRWLHRPDRYAVVFGNRPVPLSHPRLCQELLCDEGLQAAAAYTCFLPYQCVGSCDWTRRMQNARMTQDSIAAKMLDLNTHFYPHFYHNLRRLPGAFCGARLYGQFSGVPAVVCGAGPSLDRLMPQRTGVKESALLIGCGSALTAMTAVGVYPHLGVGFSSSDAEAHRFADAASWGFPMAYRLRLNRHAHDRLKGPRLYTNGSCGLSVVRWVEAQLGIEGDELQEGPSVVHLATDLAVKMGCNPIVYVGLDLAYTREQSYAAGVMADDDQARIWATSIDGRPIQTKAPWLTEAQLLAEAIKGCPTTEFLNATGAGLGLPGVPNGHLPSWPKRSIQLDLDGMPHVTDGAVTAVMQTLQESLRRCIAFLKELVGHNDVVAEVELEMELAYQEILQPMAQFRRHYLARVYDRFADPNASSREIWQWLLQEGQRNLNLLEEFL